MKTTKIFLLCICFLLLALVFVNRSSFQFHPTSRTDALSASVEKFPIVEKISYGGGQSAEVTTVIATSGQSVLDLLSKTKQIEIQESSLGKLVTSIEGVKNGTQKKYWTYMVNGKEGDVGAAEYILKANDMIEWEFKSYEK